MSILITGDDNNGKSAILEADDTLRVIADETQSPPLPRSYRPMVDVGEVDGDGAVRWSGNALRFRTYDEAEANAMNLMNRWVLVCDVRVDTSPDAPNYEWKDGRLVPIP